MPKFRQLTTTPILKIQSFTLDICIDFRQKCFQFFYPPLKTWQPVLAWCRPSYFIHAQYSNSIIFARILSMEQAILGLHNYQRRFLLLSKWKHKNQITPNQEWNIHCSCPGISSNHSAWVQTAAPNFKWFLTACLFLPINYCLNPFPMILHIYKFCDLKIVLFFCFKSYANKSIVNYFSYRVTIQILILLMIIAK